MSYYPNGHFVREFARRTRQNFEAIGAGEKLQWQDTALISFLLAVFVLPHERTDQDKYMVDLLKASPIPLENVVEILKRRPPRAADQAGDPPTDLDQLPTYLRHAVAHFNIRPLSEDEQNLTHLLVWNRIPNQKKYGNNAGKISFVARVNIEGLRTLAIHVLEQLAQTEVADRYEGIDPITEFEQHWTGEGR